MATRDLHDQRILRALEGIEKQLKEFNGNFAKTESDDKKHSLAINYPDGFLMKTLETFTNSDGTVTPIVPSKSIDYYVRYNDLGGIIRSIVIAGAKLLENKVLRINATDIFFCCESEDIIDE